MILQRCVYSSCAGTRRALTHFPSRNAAACARSRRGLRSVPGRGHSVDLLSPGALL